MNAPEPNFGRKAFGFIAAGVTVFAIIAWLTARYTTPYTSAVVVTDRAHAIAVLPFENISGDSTQNELAGRMTDSLTEALGREPGLKVAPSASTFEFRSVNDVNVQQVGAALGVATVLRGTVRRQGGQLHVNVRLLETGSRAELWSNGYARDTAEALALRNDIVRETASRITAATPSRVP